MSKHAFLLRRLHSLSGIVPVGLFLIAHLFTNAQMAWPSKGEGNHFQHEVDFIHSIPGLLFIEMALWGGIGFHAALGIYYAVSGNRGNLSSYKYQGNVRYTLQRITAWIALIFIFLHIATLRWRVDLFGWFTPFYAHGGADGGLIKHTFGHDVEMALPFTAYALQYSKLVVILYLVGALSCVYHWANGLWTAAITWGVTTTKTAMMRWGAFCILLGSALSFFTFAGIYGALSFDLKADTSFEQKVIMAATLTEHSTVLESELFSTLSPEEKEEAAAAAEAFRNGEQVDSHAGSSHGH